MNSYKKLKILGRDSMNIMFLKSLVQIGSVDKKLIV